MATPAERPFEFSNDEAVARVAERYPAIAALRESQLGRWQEVAWHLFLAAVQVKAPGEYTERVLARAVARQGPFARVESEALLDDEQRELLSAAVREFEAADMADASAAVSFVCGGAVWPAAPR